ncbi:MAG: hypothetical protein H6772_01145 [Pseudomonadales bacterium]|nr:hypothetical protein [Pseudomonadales bacterium]
MNKLLIKLGFFLLIVSVSCTTGFFISQYFFSENSELISPFVSLQENISYPLLTYSINNLRTRTYLPSNIKIEKLISKEDKFDSYLFSYITQGKRMTGQLNIPDIITASPLQKHSVIIMIRGYVPEEIYTTGVGTKSAAAELANNGFITIAPDFFGYGESDPEPNDSWQTRFEKPILIIELIKSLEQNGIPRDLSENTISNDQNLKVDNIGIWAHSNGGQIALETLEILDQKIPTTLWAPVTAPFPYSVLYFGDELEDEGKEQRKWISMFEEKYDAFDFSLTKHLNFLQGPIQIQHGDADDAALIYWSQEFINKINLENKRREKLSLELESIKNSSSSTKKKSMQNLEEIEISLQKYPDTNHNMIPSWNKAIAKDIQFFNKYLN